MANKPTTVATATTERREAGAATFWDHLDALRGCLLRVAAITVAAAAVAFALKERLFAILLAPSSSDFVTFRHIGGGHFALRLVNVGLTEQLMAHIKAAVYAGLLVASPYIIYALFRFVSPALYTNERRYATRVVAGGYVMFVLGNAVNYFVAFPLAVRFLGTYQVSPDVGNMLTLGSYIDTLIAMSLTLGAVFELPVVCWLLAKLGLLTARMMSRCRRHAIVAILIVAAVITPTTDAMTLLVVAVPVWMLYEASIIMVRLTRKPQPSGHNEPADKAERHDNQARTAPSLRSNGNSIDTQSVAEQGDMA